MGDPLSTVASAIAVAGAAKHICKAISRLRTLGELPGRVYALRNEVTDLEVVCRRLQNTLHQSLNSADLEDKSLEDTLGRAKGHLAELSQTIGRFATACQGTGPKFAIKRTTLWLGEQSRLQSLQEKIRCVKETLTAFVGVSNSRDLEQVRLELRNITILTTTSALAAETSTSAMSNDLKGYHLDLSSLLDQHHAQLSGRLDALEHHLMQPSSSNSRRMSDFSRASTLVEPDDGVEKPAEGIRIAAYQQHECRTWCPCACHIKRSERVTQAGLTERLIGRLFVGYKSLPLLSKPCSYTQCKNQREPALTVEYWFPWWFVALNVNVQLKYLQHVGPQLQLTTTRRVPDTAQCITYVMQGNIQGLHDLFTRGQASVRDVSDSRGYSLMRWALYGTMRPDVVQYLISQGATIDETSYDFVWDWTLRGKFSKSEEQGLRCITAKDECVDDQNFPLAHRIVLGFSSKRLRTELEENPLSATIIDSQSRTALSWAAARGDVEAVRLLLDFGSDPSTMDMTGRTALLNAADSNSAECVQLLLEHGGNPNPNMPRGIYRSSALNAATIEGNVRMLRDLLEADANPNACGPEGLTPLHTAARVQRAECSYLLLEHGADLNATSRDGRTPLTMAITNNNHDVLRLFVNECHEYTSSLQLSGPKLLHVVAEYADTESMSILASCHPLKLAYELSEDTLHRCRKLLDQRCGRDEKLSMAFENLVSIAQAHSMENSVDSLMEGGLFFSAKSSVHDELAEAMANLDHSNQSSPSTDESAEMFREAGEALTPTS